jgi:hypothetical protein
MAEQRKSQPRSAVEIVRPVAPPRVNLVVAAGATAVCGRVTPDIEYVIVGIYRAAQVPDTPTGGPDERRVTPVAGEFSADVPNAVAGADNVVKVWGYTSGGEVDRKSLSFLGQAAQVVQSVDATCCLWFAWAPSAPPAPPGPYGEAIDSHRPVGLLVPVGARTVSITAQGTWRHNPSDECASDANGRTNAPPEAEKPEYHNYGAGPKPGGTLPLNMLVGFWEIGGAARAACPDELADELAIGSSWLDHEVPDGATRLFLGFHDGFEWNNNSGAVQATITWAPPPLPIERPGS